MQNVVGPTLVAMATTFEIQSPTGLLLLLAVFHCTVAGYAL